MKKLVSLTALIGAVALFIAACSESVNNGNTRASNSSTGNAANTVANTAGNAVNTVANAVSKATTDDPNDFMKAAAQGGMAEVQLGKLASTKGANAEIKKFGQMMVTDHGALGKELEALAKKKNFTLPTDTGSHQSTIDDMSKLSGAEFDKEYVDAMVDDHEDDLDAFQKQADNSTDADVKAFAAKAVPVIKKHLDAIKAIQAKMNGATPAKNSNK